MILRSTLFHFALIILSALTPSLASASDPIARQRQRMVQEIVEMAEQLNDPRVSIPDVVLEAMGRVPRHRFVPEAYAKMAYANRPLPIAAGQTISQPYIGAAMTALSGVKRGAKVLEVGTGSGYQAAILAELGADVYTIEIIPELSLQAQSVLKDLGYTKVQARSGDGYQGWPEAAPFDAVIVTAAADHVPKPLVEQLKPGARLVIPVGAGTQALKLITRDKDGGSSEESLFPVLFVPLTRQDAK